MRVILVITKSAQWLARHELDVPHKIIMSIDVNHCNDLEEGNTHKGIGAGEMIKQGHPILKLILYSFIFKVKNSLPSS